MLISGATNYLDDTLFRFTTNLFDPTFLKVNEMKVNRLLSSVTKIYFFECDFSLDAATDLYSCFSDLYRGKKFALQLYLNTDKHKKSVSVCTFELRDDKRI